MDRETQGLSRKQTEQAERLANEIVFENRPVRIRFVPLEEARQLGLRKLSAKRSGELRLIDITDFDLTACGGTHVNSTGQIGTILLRKTEKGKQAGRVELVFGRRPMPAARKDNQTHTAAAARQS